MDSFRAARTVHGKVLPRKDLPDRKGKNET